MPAVKSERQKLLGFQEKLVYLTDPFWCLATATPSMQFLTSSKALVWQDKFLTKPPVS
jgi:hypothetical protein